MSEGSDKDYKPILQGKKLKPYTADRPRRATRKEVDYKESAIVLESDEETWTTTQGVVKGELVSTWARRSICRLADREESDLGSEGTRQYGSEPEGTTTDRQGQSEFWSLRTLQSKTTGLFQSIQEVQQQIAMASEHNKGGSNSMEAIMQLLLQARLDDQARDRKREEEREERRQEERRE